MNYFNLRLTAILLCFGQTYVEAQSTPTPQSTVYPVYTATATPFIQPTPTPNFESRANSIVLHAISNDWLSVRSYVWNRATHELAVFREKNIQPSPQESGGRYAKDLRSTTWKPYGLSSLAVLQGRDLPIVSTMTGSGVWNVPQNYGAPIMMGGLNVYGDRYLIPGKVTNYQSMPSGEGGIIVMDRSNYSWSRFLGGTAVSGLKLGQDGYLYAIVRDPVTLKSGVQKIDPFSMTVVSTVLDIQSVNITPLLAIADTTGRVFIIGNAIESGILKLNLYVYSSGFQEAKYKLADGVNPLILDISVNEYGDVAILEGISLAMLHIFKREKSGSLSSFTKVVERWFDNRGISFDRPEESIEYCSARTITASDFRIRSVTLNPRSLSSIYGIGRAVSYSTVGYEDFTNFQLNRIRAGTRPRITIQPEFRITPKALKYDVYLDINRDGDFVDSGELVLSGSADSLFTGDLVIPTNFANPGTSTLRIIQQDTTTNAASCNSIRGIAAKGQIEDYRVLLSN